MNRFKIYIFLLIVLSITKSIAQNTVEYGIKAGLSRSNMVSRDNSKAFHLRHSGIVVGGYVKFPLSDRLYFQPELLLTQKGDMEEYKGVILFPSKLIESVLLDVGDILDTKTLTYLSIPLNINVSVSKRIGLTIGGEPSILLHKRTRREFTAEVGEDWEANLVRKYKAFDLGISFGVNVNMGKAHIDVRYIHGLLNNWEMYNETYFNSSIQLSLGYRLFKKASYY